MKSLTMDEDDLVVADFNRAGDIFLASKPGTEGQPWPTFFRSKEKTYKYAASEPLPCVIEAKYLGYARYAFFSFEPVCEMRLCEQHYVVLRPNQLYIFTVDPTCPKCVEIAKSYEGHE